MEWIHIFDGPVTGRDHQGGFLMDARCVARSIIVILALTAVPIPITADDFAHNDTWPPADPDRASRLSYHLENIVVNEAYPDPDTDVNGDGSADQNDEFIELFNAGITSIDIGGWTLSDLSDIFMIGALTIGIGDHLSFGRDQTGLVLGSEENVTLRDDLGNTVDILGWKNSKKGCSYFRCPDGAERIREKKAPTPASANPLPPYILINEVMPDPAGPNEGAQWLEIMNVEDREELIGSRITNSESMDLFLPSLTLVAGERAIICIGDSDRLEIHPPDVRMIELESEKTLFVNGDDLQFIDPEGYLTDFIAWGNSSHVDPPMDIMDRVQWNGKLWDPLNGTMTGYGSENPSPKAGLSLMRRGDSVDTDSPGDLISGTEELPCTPGWSNDLDPTIEIELAGELDFDISERRTFALIMRPRYNGTSLIDMDITIDDQAWSLEGGGRTIINRTGSDPIGTFFNITAPGDLNNHTAVLSIYAHTIGWDWFQCRSSHPVLIPSCDLAVEGASIQVDGDIVTNVPEGAFAMVKGFIMNNGEIPTHSSEVHLGLNHSCGTTSVQNVTLGPIGAGGKRSFSFELDTLGWTGVISATVMADAPGDIPEFDETNNIVSMNATILPTPILAGEEGLTLDRVLFNASSSERYAILFNPSDAPVELGGMMIGDLEGYFILPGSASIGPNASVALAWGEDVLPRIPQEVPIFRGDGEGPRSRQMDRIGRVPDPLSSGVLVLETRYRKTIDVLCIGQPSSSMVGWKDIDGIPVRSTYGTEVRRVRDSEICPVDSNSSLDWTCNGGEASLFAFCPSPDPASASEFVSVLFGGSDPSGFMITCGGRAIVVPNGTDHDHGLFTTAKEADRFLSSQGKTPDALFGYPEGDITGMRVPGWGSFILSDNGGDLSLWDPSCRLLDSVRWGEAGIGEAAKDAVFMRIGPMGSGEAEWAYGGRASSHLALDLVSSDIGSCSATIFTGLGSALEWVSGPGPMKARSDIPFHELVEALVAAGPGSELFLDIPPWEEVTNYHGPMAERKERIAASIFLEEEDVRVHHPVSRSSGSGCAISCGNRTVIISNVSGSVLSYAIGYEMPDPSYGNALSEAIIGSEAEWLDSSEVLRSHEPDIVPFNPGPSPEYDPDVEILTAAPLEVVPGPVPPRGISGCSDLIVLDTNGILDLPSIMNAIPEGAKVRALIAPGPHPVLDPDDEVRSRLKTMVGSGGFDLRPYDNDPFARAIAINRIAKDRGFDMEVRMLPFNGGPSLPGTIIGNGCLYSSVGGRAGPGNAFWFGISGLERLPRLEWAELLWNLSLPIPDGMLGTGNIGPEGPESGALRIEEVYYDTYIPYDPDEYVAIYNPGDELVEMDGWTLSDDEGADHPSDGTILFGSGAIGPGRTFYVARNGSAFRSQHGFDPDLSWEDPEPNDAPFLTGTPLLTNGNDSVCLRDPKGRIVDVVPFGRCIWNVTPWRYIHGGSWSGPAAPDSGWGHILYRAHSSAGRGADSDSRDDWLTLRPRYPGQSGFWPFMPAVNSTVRVGICPDSSSQVLSDLISGSKNELRINVYELWSEWITNALIGARERGVDVSVILEGGPVSGISEAEKVAISSLVVSGIEVRLMWNDAAVNSRDRYRYDHAKYVVSDEDAVLVSSDNFKDTSFPPPGSIPTSGTRGWVASVRSPALAKDLLRVFSEDWVGLDMRSAEDVLELETYSVPLSSGIDLLSDDDAIFAPGTSIDRSNVQLLIAPDHLSDHDNPLIESITGAREEVLCQLLDLSPSFDLRTMNSDVYPRPLNGSVMMPGSTTSNPYLDALFKAARNGAQVKVILDGSDFDSDGEPENLPVAEWVRAEAASRNLSASLRVELMPSPAHTGNGDIGLVHNKGIVIDGAISWISSLNWGPTSALENREVGLLIGSEEVGRTLRGAFLFDWGLTLQDEVEVRKEGWTLKPLNDTWIMASVTVTVISRPPEGIRLALTGGTLIGAVNGEVAYWTAGRTGNTTTIRYEGPCPEGNELILLASDGGRTTFITSLNVEIPEREESEDWDSPFYRDPLFPLLLMIIIPIAASIPLALYKSMRKASNIGPDEE
jgi:cardiolipin synthase